MKQTSIVALVIFVSAYILTFIWFTWKLAVIICLLQLYIVLYTSKYEEK